MFNTEQEEELTRLDMQNNPLTGNCPPSYPQHQLHQTAVPAQSQNGYSTQHPPSQSLTNRQHYQQQMDYPNGNITPFHYNLGHVPAFYSSSELVTSLHPQQAHQPCSQPLQMNTYVQAPPQLQQQLHHQYHYDSKAGGSTRLSDEENEHSTTGQFKVMTSKERRQLRNKVSARNFRNRRKEYITSLEAQVDTFKNENGQLQLEIKWVRTTMNKLQKENDDLRVKLALCQGGITTKQESTLSDRHSSQGLSPLTAAITTPPVPPSPALPLLSDHPTSVQHTLTTTDTNTSQKPAISTSALTQNGNSSFTIPDLHGSSHHHHQQQQQQHITSPVSLDSTEQQPASIYSHENNEKSNASVLASASSSSPGANLDSIDTGSSFYHAGHLSSSTHFTVSTNAWDLALPNSQGPLTYPLDATITQPLLVPPLFENSSSFYSLESQQNPVSTNQQHLTSIQAHRPSHHVQQHDQLPPSSSSSRSQPPDQQLEHTTIDNTINNNNNNNSYVSTAVFPDFDFGTALGKQQVSDGSILWKYPLLVPALLSIIIDHTMTMSTDELLSHTRLLSTPTPTPARRLLPIDHVIGSPLKPPCLGSNSSMAPGLRCPLQQHHRRSSLMTDAYPLSKKQLDALWDHLLDQMMVTTTSQQASSTTMMVDEENKASDWNHGGGGGGGGGGDDQHQTLWDNTPVTGFKAICPLYWMQRQLCRFVITYVIVKYPQLEIPCKTYLPICEQFRRRLITTPS